MSSYYMEIGPNGVPIWLPPTMLKARFSGNRLITASWAVIVEDSVKSDNIKLGYLPFPNIYNPSLDSISRVGQICFGTSRLSEMPENPDKGQLISALIDLLLNSTWNSDYLSATTAYPENMQEKYEDLSDDLKLGSGYANSVGKLHLQLISCMRDKQTCSELKWKQFPQERL